VGKTELTAPVAGAAGAVACVAVVIVGKTELTAPVKIDAAA